MEFAVMDVAHGSSAWRCRAIEYWILLRTVLTCPCVPVAEGESGWSFGIPYRQRFWWTL